MNLEELKNQIRAVHEARLHEAICRETVNILKEEWESTHASTIEAAKKAFIQQRDAEENLRRLTLEAYAETGSKSPAPGLGIREVQKLVYEDSVAQLWGYEHGMALQLDKRAFEKIAKATPLDFVVILPEPQATIATDLSEAVKQLEEAKSGD